MKMYQPIGGEINTIEQPHKMAIGILTVMLQILSLTRMNCVKGFLFYLILLEKEIEFPFTLKLYF